MSWDEKQERELEGDFAAGERTEPITLPEEVAEEESHGDFAAGERTVPLKPEDVVPGDFATGEEKPHGREEPGTFADTEPEHEEAESTGATPAQPIDVTATVVADEFGVQTTRALAVQGNYAVLVAQFADMDAAKLAYDELRDAEAKRAIDIHGALVVNADYMGKVHIQTMTDHTTRNGFLWGAVAGVVVGLIFPPSILVDTAAVAIAGAALGKAGNELKKSAAAHDLTSVITPGTSGIVVLAAITAVDAVKQTIPQATAVKTAPVSDETAEAVKTAATSAGGTSTS